MVDVLAEADLEAVEIGRIGAPEAGRVDLQFELHLRGGDERGSRSLGPVRSQEACPHRQAGRGSGDGQVGNEAAMHVRGEGDGFDMASVAGFEADRLPEPTNGAVPRHLAVRDFGEGTIGKGRNVRRWQRHLHFELVLGLEESGVESQLKGEIGALVRADLLAVDEDDAGLAHRAELQGQFLARDIRREGKTTPIGGVTEAVREIGKLRLPGHRDLRLAPVSILVPELPDPIERQALPRPRFHDDFLHQY